MQILQKCSSDISFKTCAILYNKWLNLWAIVKHFANWDTLLSYHAPMTHTAQSLILKSLSPVSLSLSRSSFLCIFGSIYSFRSFLVAKTLYWMLEHCYLPAHLRSFPLSCSFSLSDWLPICLSLFFLLLAVNLSIFLIDWL